MGFDVAVYVFLAEPVDHFTDFALDSADFLGVGEVSFESVSLLFELLLLFVRQIFNGLLTFVDYVVDMLL